MLTTFRTLLKGALRDRISLFFAIVFPIGFLLVLGFVFPNPGYRQQLLAGMLAVSTLFFSLNGIAFESLYQRNSGVYKLLRATPYPTIAFITNLTASRSVVALLSCALVAIVGVLTFGLTLSWQSMLLILPIIVLGTLCFTFLGLTISNLVQNENQVAMLNNIVTLPMIFSSATFYSLSAAPAWVSTIGHAFPFSYLIDGEHAALARNAPGIVFPSLILLAFTVLSLLLAVATFRWDPNTPIIRRVLRTRAA
ncbi:MAG TPA: ABC transporter permease [Ktedonobacteraceae bacterium]